MNFDHILLRLKQSLGVTTDKEVAAFLGMSKTALAERKRRDAFPREQLAVAIGKHPEANLDEEFILTGVTQVFQRHMDIIKAASDVVQSLDELTTVERSHVHALLSAVGMKNVELIRELVGQQRGDQGAAVIDSSRKTRMHDIAARFDLLDDVGKNAIESMINALLTKK